MAQMRSCDERHNDPSIVKAEYMVTQTSDTYTSSKDYCHDHFRNAISPLLTGGLRSGVRYTLEKL
jgi:hypothetical protein